MSKTTKVRTWIASAFIITGIGCILAFNLIGSTVDESGMVQEPFFLIPLGIITFLMGIVVGVLALVSRIKDKKKMGANNSSS